jgi:hypothetical protein
MMGIPGSLAYTAAQNQEQFTQMKLHSCVLALALGSVGFRSPLPAQQPLPSPTPTAQPSPAPTPAQEVPAIDGAIGPCSVEFTVNDGYAKPVYAATVKVRIAYGFGGIKKLDLEAGTNSDGKVKFKGLPAKVHNPPLEFHASKDDLTGLASYNPVIECQAKHDIILEKVKPPAGL